MASESVFLLTGRLSGGPALARAFPAVRARFGAIERAFYLAAIAWFTVFAVACTTGAR